MDKVYKFLDKFMGLLKKEQAQSWNKSGQSLYLWSDISHQKDFLKYLIDNEFINRAADFIL